MNHTSLTKKFINLLMIAGKKNTACKIFFAAVREFLFIIKNKKRETHSSVENTSIEFHYRHGEEKNKFQSIIQLLETAVKNIQPNIEGRKCRVGGSTKLVPAVISNSRGITLALRWIIESANNRKKRSKISLSRSLAHELVDAYEKQGQPRLRRGQVHKMCEGNRGFLRYRWW